MDIRARRTHHHLWDARLDQWRADFERWSINFSTRKQLLTLDEQQLRDIGIDSIDAEQEARKPFWRR